MLTRAIPKTRVVAVLNAGTQGHEVPVRSREWLSRYATTIGHHAGVATEVISRDTLDLLDTSNPDNRRHDLAAIVALHDTLAPGTAPDFPRVDVPVISDHDALTITVTAAALTQLSRARRPTARGRIVIAGADTLPNLSPLLIAVEAGEVTMWRTADRRSFPLRSIAAGADVMINLLGDDSEVHTVLDVARQDGVPVITPDPIRDPLLVLPALVGVLVEDPTLRLDPVSDLRLYSDVGHACAMALVMATPPQRTYPLTHTQELTDRVRAAAQGAIQEHRQAQQGDIS